MYSKQLGIAISEQFGNLRGWTAILDMSTITSHNGLSINNVSIKGGEGLRKF